ncbi:MAG: hypothetical protein HQ521_06070 [Bacteroidetes bacterium]|nr:hypothetical protein [Bacteroidota bacterium]
MKILKLTTPYSTKVLYWTGGDISTDIKDAIVLEHPDKNHSCSFEAMKAAKDYYNNSTGADAKMINFKEKK